MARPSPTTDPTTPGTAGVPSRPNAADVLVRRTTIIAAVADLAVMAVLGTVIPPLAVFALLTLVLLVVLRRRPAGLTITLGVLALLSNLGGIPFWTADLAAPGDSLTFLWAVLAAGSRFVAVVAAVVASRQPATAERIGRLLGSAAVGLLAVAVVVTVVARSGTDRAELAAGDVPVAIDGFAFPAAPVTVDSGGTLHVTNQDPTRHTFTVAGTDLAPMVLGSSATRVPVDLPPGTYDVICEVPGHEAMTGTLEVR